MSLPSFEQARRIVEQHATSIGASQTEQIALIQSTGRVLAQTISADRDLPPFPRAARDGFALRAEDVTRVPAKLTVVAEIRAGMDVSSVSIGLGQCAEIMTGAVAPQGADAVVMVEYTARKDDRVEIQRS
ncbi:MAG TPA: molybdopterin molybdenumtransferase MoeA, partial [Terriglobales bacterium]|nr:molybdopterin molybdenumtransferase MoeA [Terriglobales bacterium]